MLGQGLQVCRAVGEFRAGVSQVLGRCREDAGQDPCGPRQGGRSLRKKMTREVRERTEGELKVLGFKKFGANLDSVSGWGVRQHI